MGNDVAVVIHHEHSAAANTGFLQAVEDGVQRNYGGKHAGKLIAGIAQRHGNHERRAVVGSQRQRIAAKLHYVELLRLHASYKGALQGFGYKGILLRAEISLRGAGPFPRAAHGGEIDKGSAIAVDEIFQQASYFWFRDGIFHIVDQSSQRENLAFAHQLLGEIGFEELNFLRERAGQIGLVHSFVVRQFSLTEVQYLAVIQTKGDNAEQQHRAKHQPENTDAPDAHTIPDGLKVDAHNQTLF